MQLSDDNSTEVVVSALNPGSYSAVQNKVDGYVQKYIPLCTATNANNSRLITDVLAGCPKTAAFRETITYTTGALYEADTAHIYDDILSGK